jgi:hypothetical protein
LNPEDFLDFLTSLEPALPVHDVGAVLSLGVGTAISWSLFGFDRDLLVLRFEFELWMSSF